MKTRRRRLLLLAVCAAWSPLADARAYRMIVATTLDGAALSIGGLGPLWAVYDADRLSAYKDKPRKERFGLCPLGAVLHRGEAVMKV